MGAEAEEVAVFTRTAPQNMHAIDMFYIGDSVSKHVRSNFDPL